MQNKWDLPWQKVPLILQQGPGPPLLFLKLTHSKAPNLRTVALHTSPHPYAPHPRSCQDIIAITDMCTESLELQNNDICFRAPQKEQQGYPLHGWTPVRGRKKRAIFDPCATTKNLILSHLPSTEVCTKNCFHGNLYVILRQKTSGGH